jgi:hypothetical protein
MEVSRRLPFAETGRVLFWWGTQLTLVAIRDTVYEGKEDLNASTWRLTKILYRSVNQVRYFN